MKNTIKATSKLLALWLLCALIFQGCAAYPPRQPVYYPPPTPQPQQETNKKPIPHAEPNIQTPKPVNAIAVNFSRQAAEKTRQGRPDLAASTLERGLRVAPKDAMLWSQLAEVKLQQQLYQQARSLAAKSNSLAGTNTAIIQKNHWIIEESLKRAAAHK